MLFLTIVFLVTSGILAGSNSDLFGTFVELQKALRERRSVLGDGSYECYSNGACALEFRQDGLLTYREELLCSRSEEGCGESLVERKKREEQCGSLHEELQLCGRSAADAASCGDAVLRSVEEQGCGEVLERRRRSECAAVARRSEELCGAWGSKKRSVSEECSLAMREMEEMECGSSVQLQKRDGECEGAGWKKSGNACYKYFPGPATYQEAWHTCNQADGRLATPEKMVSANPTDRQFFNDLIQSSGTKTKIDEVLGDMDEHFGGKNWDEVIDYYDNWGWIGVKMDEVTTGEDGVVDIWKWNEEGNQEQLPVKIGQADWARKQPSFKNAVGTDGRCVVYFHDRETAVEEETKAVDMGAWWNVNCKMSFPFICEIQNDL